MITVTDSDIRKLRREAIDHGDYKMVDLCNRALSVAVTDQDGNEIPYDNWTRDEARAECERVILEARDARLELTSDNGRLGLRDPRGGVWWPLDAVTTEDALWTAYNAGARRWRD